MYTVGVISNFYDYANIQLIAGADTNSVVNLSVTNLPGRVEISADGYLNRVRTRR